MDSASTQHGHMLPPPRRPYKRVTARKWHEQKARIRELIVEQEEKLEDAIRILKERDDFDVGERQLKRKLKEWEFTRNVPQREMRHMVHKRKKRQDELERPTEFMRRQGSGEFQRVPEEKLDRFQRRSGLANDSLTSPSFSTPPNIIYNTPSSANRNSCPDSPDSPNNLSRGTREFIDSVERIFGNLEQHESDLRSDSPSPSLEDSSVILSNQDPWALEDSAFKLTFDANYRAAGKNYELASLLHANVQGSSNWRAVEAEFRAALMKAADFPGCPQSIITRFADEASRFLARERRQYARSNPQERNLTNLRMRLTSLEMITKWVSQVITQQRTLQIWEPVLGPGHPKIENMRNNIDSMRPSRRVNLNKEPWLVQKVEDSFLKSSDLHNIPQLKRIGDLLHLGDGPPDVLLNKFLALERSDISGRSMRQEMKLLRLGRSMSLMGMFFSFVKRFEDAEIAFQESDRYMSYEASVEIKLHRVLWYAEHKTRVQEREYATALLHQAHEVYMKNEVSSEFVVAHFPGRFKLLCDAVSRGVSIDEVMDEVSDDSASTHQQDGSPPASVRDNTRDRPASPQAQLASPIPSLERLFPMTPEGFPSEFGVEAWRQFMVFSPSMNSPHMHRSLSLTRS